MDRLLGESTSRLDVLGIMLADKIFELYYHIQELLYSKKQMSYINTQNKPA